MKNYLFALAALIIAIGAAAFTSSQKENKPSTTKLFLYAAPGGSFSKANVENRLNWQLATSLDGCNREEVKACGMEVDQSQVNPDNTLKSSINIQAVETSTNVARVQSANAIDILNRN